MKKPNVSTILLGLFFIGVVFYLYQQNEMLKAALRRQQSQIEESTQTVGASGKGKDIKQDPYVLREIKNTIIKNASLLQQCWLKYLETNPAITKGNIYFDWTVLTDGTPEKPEVIRGDFLDKTLGECLAQKISTLKFPPPPWGEKKYIEYTLTLEKEGDSAKKDNQPVLVTTPQEKK